jgi:hypothetical protein
MLSAKPVIAVPSTPESMPDEFDDMYRDQMARIGANIISKERKPLKKGLFSGTEVVYALVDKGGDASMQYILLMTDGTQLWSGQLTTADTNDIKHVYYILENAEKRTDDVIVNGNLEK